MAASDYFIRPATPDDAPCLWEMLYEAFNAPAGDTPLPRDMIYQPEVRKYVESWGAPDDLGFVAVDQHSHQRLGAAWLRLLVGANGGYGYVDDYTPELTVAMAPEQRGLGVGRRLLTRLFAAARRRYAGICLSVWWENPALQLYRRLGFTAVGERDGSITMQLVWRP
jgi:ribosomal protein S18 acetylase RimI-like enzyme